MGIWSGISSCSGGRPRRTLIIALIVLVASTAGALGASLDFLPADSSPEVTPSPRWIAAADIDGDGDQDLAVANQVVPGTISILKNNGSGDFVEPASSPEPLEGWNPSFVAAADLDGDGDQDLALINVEQLGAPTGEVVRILKNNGSGNFSELASTPDVSSGDLSVLGIGDLDGDSDLDVAVADSNNSNVAILKNNGNGVFFEAPHSPHAVSGNNPRTIAVADLDGDSDADLAVGSSNNHSVTILKNSGTANFHEPSSSPETDASPAAIVAADLDGDGDQDLASGDSDPVTSNTDMSVLKNNGHGNFFEPASSPETVPSLSRAIAAADFDGDGDPDIAVTDGFRRLTILRNNGRGNFSEPPTSPENAGASPLSFVAADLDGDADPDLAIANVNPDLVTILKNR